MYYHRATRVLPGVAWSHRHHPAESEHLRDRDGV